MTVAEMVTYVSQILSDTGFTKWQSSTHIVPSLNNAQNEFVLRILSFVSQNRKAHELIGELESKTTSINIASTGYALSGVDSSAPYMRNGFVAASCTIDGETVWCNYLPSPDIKKQQNYFLRGNDDKPDCYVFNERFYVVASTGSYPVPTIIYYIREPRVFVSSGATGYQITTCELNAMFHYLICEMAAAKCWRMLGDESSIRKYENIMKLINDEIQGIAIGGMIAPDRKEVSD